MKQSQLIFLFFILFAAFSCKKKECDNPNVVDGINLTELPPATMTGANTMGCLINGEIWLPLGRNLLGDLIYDINFDVNSPNSGGGFTIQGTRNIEDYFAIMLVSAADVLTQGEYPFLLPTSNFGDTCGVFDLDTTYNNFIEITKIDFEEEILSGLYQMQLINNECDTLTVTEGRFDLSP
jgi:hypothetical protein